MAKHALTDRNDLSNCMNYINPFALVTLISSGKSSGTGTVGFISSSGSGS